MKKKKNKKKEENLIERLAIMSAVFFYCRLCFFFQTFKKFVTFVTN